jgi:hypothetical protein
MSLWHRLRRYLIEFWLGPLHNHEQDEPCVDCWQRAGRYDKS